MENRHRKCIAAAVVLLTAKISLTFWLGYYVPTAIEAYGISAGSFQYNWLIVPVALLILWSISVAARTQVLAERRKCFWKIGFVLLFPVSTLALLVRVLWSIE